MAGGRGLIVSGVLLVPAVVAGLAGCSNGGGQSAAPTASASVAAKAASAEGTTAAMLKKALLTHVNGVTAAAPASSGKYASLSQASKQAASGVQVTPKACTQAATEGFDPAVLAGSPAAAVTFRVGSNGVSEVLVASSDKSASAALAGHVPSECAQYEEKVGSKTFTYGVKEQAVSGVGAQAKVLNVHAVGAAAADDLWSLIYRGSGFIGTVSVVGPNASQKAVQELGQQAYAFATKTLS